MAVEWEWNESGSIEREIIVEKLLSSDGAEFAGGIVYEEFAPDWTEDFQARGVKKSELDALRSSVTSRLSTYSLTDALGTTWVGYARSLRWDRITGTNRFDVTLTLLIPPENPS